MRFTADQREPRRPHEWTEWYRFARDERGFAHDESAEYANRRFVEEQNRDALRDGGSERAGRLVRLDASAFAGKRLFDLTAPWAA
jgi:hypothetical protein